MIEIAVSARVALVSYSEGAISTEEMSIADAIREASVHPYAADELFAQEVVPGHGPVVVFGICIDEDPRRVRQLKSLGYQPVNPVTLAKFVKTFRPPRRGNTAHSYRVGTVYNGITYTYWWYRDGAEDRFDAGNNDLPEILVMAKGEG